MDVKLFANLAEAAGQRTVAVDLPAGATVAETLEAVFDRHPPLRGEVLTAEGELEDHINVLVDGSNVRHTDEGLETTLDADAELAIFPPVSGG